MEVKNNLKLIFVNFWLNLLKHAQYRVSFILNILFMMINNAFFLIQWAVVFSIVNTIGGYGFQEILLIWAIGTGGFGICNMFFGGAKKLSELIYTGKLDVYLTQPKNVLINAATSHIDISSIGDFLYGIVVLIILKANIMIWLFYFPIIILSGIILAAMLCIMSSVAFYIKRGDAVASSFFSAFVSFSIYPPTIFSTSIKVFLYTVIPVGFAVFIPMSMLLSFDWVLLLEFVGFTILITLLAFFVFSKGLRRYSSGNILSARM